MKFIRDRADARFLPSRFQSALFRLGAFLVLSATPPQPRPGLALAIDRHQSATETFAKASAFVAVSVFYIAVGLSRLMHIVPAIVLAVIVTPVLAHVPMFVGGRVWTMLRESRAPRNNIPLTSILTFAPVFIASLYFATTSGVALYVGWAVLFAVGAEIVAAAILRALRDRIVSLEERFAS